MESHITKPRGLLSISPPSNKDFGLRMCFRVSHTRAPLFYLFAVLSKYLMAGVERVVRRKKTPYKVLYLIVIFMAQVIAASAARHETKSHLPTVLTKVEFKVSTRARVVLSS